MDIFAHNKGMQDLINERTQEVQTKLNDPDTTKAELEVLLQTLGGDTRVFPSQPEFKVLQEALMKGLQESTGQSDIKGSAGADFLKDTNIPQEAQERMAETAQIPADKARDIEIAERELRENEFNPNDLIRDQDMMVRDEDRGQGRVRLDQAGAEPGQDIRQNLLSAPIPGESMTNPVGGSRNEQPPTYVNIKDAAEATFDKLVQPRQAARLVKLLESGATVEALSRTIAFAGVAKGEWTVDLALPMARDVIMWQIMGIAKRAGVQNIQVLNPDQDQVEFMSKLNKGKPTPTTQQPTTPEEASPQFSGPFGDL